MPQRRSRQKRCGLDGKPEAFRTGRGKATHQRHDTRDKHPLDFNPDKDRD